MRRPSPTNLIALRRALCSAACFAALAAAGGAQGAAAQATDLHGVAAPLSSPVSEPATVSAPVAPVTVSAPVKVSAPVTLTSAQASGPMSASGHVLAPAHGAAPVAAHPSSVAPSPDASSDGAGSVKGAAVGVRPEDAPASAGGAARTLTSAAPRTPVQATAAPVITNVRRPADAATVVTPARAPVQPILRAVPTTVSRTASAGTTLVAAGTRTLAPVVRGTVPPAPAVPSVPALPVLRSIVPTPTTPSVLPLPVIHSILPTHEAPAVPTLATTLSEATGEARVSSLIPTAAGGGSTGPGGSSGGGVLSGMSSVAVPKGPTSPGIPVGARHGPRGGDSAPGIPGGGSRATSEPAAGATYAAAANRDDTAEAASGLLPAEVAIETSDTASRSSADLPVVGASPRVVVGDYTDTATASWAPVLYAGGSMAAVSPSAPRAWGLFSERGAVEPSSASVPAGGIAQLAPAGGSPSVAGSSSASGSSLLLTLAGLALAGNAIVARRLRLASLLKRAAPVVLLPTRPG
jgi:hypothetical protein